MVSLAHGENVLCRAVNVCETFQGNDKTSLVLVASSLNIFSVVKVSVDEAIT